MAAPVITPAEPLALRGKALQHFASDQDVTWSKSGGAFSGTAVRAVDWTAPNITYSYTVTATNGAAESTTVTIAVTAVVPYVPDWNLEPEDGKRVLGFRPDSGPMQTRTKGRDDTFPFTRNVAQKAEHDEMRQFWDDNYPGRLVYFNIPGDPEYLWQINSNFKRVGRRRNLWGYAFNLIRT